MAGIVIVAIVQVITLIVFFVMATNVSKIKKNLTEVSGERYLAMAEEEKYIGNREKAKEYLRRAKYKYEVLREERVIRGEFIDPKVIIAEIDKKLF